MMFAEVVLHNMEQQPSQTHANQAFHFDDPVKPAQQGYWKQSWGLLQLAHPFRFPFVVLCLFCPSVRMYGSVPLLITNRLLTEVGNACSSQTVSDTVITSDVSNQG